MYLRMRMHMEKQMRMHMHVRCQCSCERMRMYVYMRAGTVYECMSRSHSCGDSSSSPPTLQDVTVYVCTDNMHMHAHVYVHNGGHTDAMPRIGHGMEATRSLLLMSWGCLRAAPAETGSSDGRLGASLGPAWGCPSAAGHASVHRC